MSVASSVRQLITRSGRFFITTYRFFIGLWRRMWVLPIDFYKKVISPALPDSCIYEPSCSTYTRKSILRYGVVVGIFLGIFRVFRCLGLLFTGGVDPIPERLSLRAFFLPWARFWKFKRKKKKRPATGRDSDINT